MSEININEEIMENMSDDELLEFENDNYGFTEETEGVDA